MGSNWPVQKYSLLLSPGVVQSSRSVHDYWSAWRASPYLSIVKFGLKMMVNSKSRLSYLVM